jgi:hypothetical protein
LRIDLRFIVAKLIGMYQLDALWLRLRAQHEAQE